MAIIRSSIPNNSLIDQALRKYNYADSFQGLVNDRQNKLSTVDIARVFFLSAPNWADRLFGLRNKIGALFGLKTPTVKGEKLKIIDGFLGEKGQQVGLFRVFDKTANEIILGEDDKHLNFRVSLHLTRLKKNRTENQLTISTIVVFNNWFGRLYFFIVAPFHRLLVPEMLKRMIRQLEKMVDPAYYP